MDELEQRLAGLTGEQVADLCRRARQRSAGKCQRRNRDKGDSPSRAYCVRCYRQNREDRRRQKGCKPWVPGGRGRPPLDSGRAA